MDMEKVVRVYIRLRDQKEALEAECKDKVKPIKENMELIENSLYQWMDEKGVKNVKTSYGTAYQSQVNSVKVTDWQQVRNFIEENDAWDILNRAVNKTAVVNDYKGEVPGVQISVINKLNIRRS